MIYLATPYTHRDRAVMLARFRAVNKAAAALMSQGLHIFSPISHSHPIAEAGALPTTWDFWEKYDREILKCCSQVIVLMLDGWKESKGVRAEIEIAESLGIGISYAEPDALSGFTSAKN